MSDAELYKHIAQLKDLGVSTLDLQIDPRKRAAFPSHGPGCSGDPVHQREAGETVGAASRVSLSVGIGLIFRLLTELFEAVGKQNNPPVGMAVWGPYFVRGRWTLPDFRQTPAAVEIGQSANQAPFKFKECALTRTVGELGSSVWMVSLSHFYEGFAEEFHLTRGADPAER